LRVFKYRNPDEFRVVGESFKAPLPEYLERIDSPYTAEEVRGEDIAAMVRVRPDDDAPPPEVIGMNEPMPLDTSASEWRADVAAEVGCRCSVTTVPIALLRDDVQHAETTRKPVRRTIT
jgi:hypothetical protein